ncbi:MAG: RNA polymerase sigma factor [Pseudomonadota bacterium]
MREARSRISAQRPIISSTMAENLESTVELVRAFQSGDLGARDRLFERCLPLLKRWAHGRLPSAGRSLADTDDLVQVSLLRAFNRLKDFEAHRPGALLAYLRSILLNTVREELRRSQNKPGGSTLNQSQLAHPEASVLEQVIGQETVERYEAALDQLTDKQRQAVILRLEFDMSYPEIATELIADSPDAVRMLVVRGLAELVRQMQ